MRYTALKYNAGAHVGIHYVVFAYWPVLEDATGA